MTHYTTPHHLGKRRRRNFVYGSTGPSTPLGAFALSLPKGSPLCRSFSAFIAFIFACNLVIPPQNSGSAFGSPQAFAQTVLDLPLPGTMVSTSTVFMPTLIKALVIHPENPLQFDFIIDTGDTHLKGEALKTEGMKLIKYFLASLTVPEEEIWVNLSPYEKERIIPQAFGTTEMGKDLLAQDYLLKQLTASLMYPETDLGKEFWQRVYQKAYELYGTTNIPINTFNKVWIVPDKAVIYEKDNRALVVESRLKVMLEGDYLALQNNFSNNKLGTDRLNTEEVKQLSDVSSDIVKQVVLPEIEKEVNEGKTFANLRQIYNAQILAVWYKRALQESLLNQVYANKKKVRGVDVQDKEIKQKIYEQYLEAFKKGVYNYIKEDTDPVSQKKMARKYFSGGYSSEGIEDKVVDVPVKQQIPQKEQQAAEAHGDQAMLTWEAVDVGPQVKMENVQASIAEYDRLHVGEERRTIGEIVRAARILKGLDLAKLASAVNVSLPAISNIERGRRLPSFALARDIAIALGINEKDLFNKIIEFYVHDEEARDVPPGKILREFDLNERSFFQAVLDARKLQGLTQNELARAVQVSPGFISSIEKGRKLPGLEVVVRLARALGIDRERFLAKFISENISHTVQLKTPRAVQRRTVQLTEVEQGKIDIKATDRLTNLFGSSNLAQIFQEEAQKAGFIILEVEDNPNEPGVIGVNLVRSKQTNWKWMAASNELAVYTHFVEALANVYEEEVDANKTQTRALIASLLRIERARVPIINAALAIYNVTELNALPLTEAGARAAIKQQLASLSYTQIGNLDDIARFIWFNYVLRNSDYQNRKADFEDFVRGIVQQQVGEPGTRANFQWLKSETIPQLVDRIIELDRALDPFNRWQERDRLSAGQEEQSKPTILVVDDFGTETYERMLSDNYNVVSASDGDEALELVRREPEKFKLVLSDLRMINMHGDELAVHLREEFPQIPVVIATTFGSKRTLQEKSSNIREVLLKGEFNTQKLLEVIERDRLHAGEAAIPEIETSDQAALMDVTAGKGVGGINLNPALLDLQIKRDGNGIPLPINQQPIGNMKIEGFIPVIINVTPVNLPLLLGENRQETPAHSMPAQQSRKAPFFNKELAALREESEV